MEAHDELDKEEGEGVEEAEVVVWSESPAWSSF